MYLKFLLGFMSLHIASKQNKFIRREGVWVRFAVRSLKSVSLVQERGCLPSPHMTASIYDCIIILIATTSKMHVSRLYVVRSWTMDAQGHAALVETGSTHWAGCGDRCEHLCKADR